MESQIHSRSLSAFRPHPFSLNARALNGHVEAYMTCSHSNLILVHRYRGPQRQTRISHTWPTAWHTGAVISLYLRRDLVMICTRWSDQRLAVKFICTCTSSESSWVSVA
jgi:hypothetical protein